MTWRTPDFDDLSGVYYSSISHENYRDITSAYLLTGKDQAFKQEYQLKTVQRAEIMVTKTMETDHSRWLSTTEEVKNFVDSLVNGLDV